VVAAYVFLTACVEIFLVTHLETEDDEGTRPRHAPVHRARDYVRRYPEKTPFDAAPIPGYPPSHDQASPVASHHLDPIRPAEPPPRKEHGLVGDDVIPRELFGTQANSLRREMESRNHPPSPPGGNP
jgi:hypothetical protein